MSLSGEIWRRDFKHIVRGILKILLYTLVGAFIIFAHLFGVLHWYGERERRYEVIGLRFNASWRPR
jgi:hypothetical protein